MVPTFTLLLFTPGCRFPLCAHKVLVAPASAATDTSKYRDAKAAALRAHRTQHVSINRHFFDLPNVDQILSVEAFRQAFGPPLSRRPSADIFESVVTDH